MEFTDPMAKGLYANGRKSVILGLEDYGLRTKNPARLISAVRNLYAGILQLLKSKLAEESKDSEYSLLMRNIVPVLDEATGTVKWFGSDKGATVDYHLCYNCGNDDKYECCRCFNEILPADLANSSTLCGYCADLCEKEADR